MLVRYKYFFLYIVYFRHTVYQHWLVVPVTGLMFFWKGDSFIHLSHKTEVDRFPKLKFLTNGKKDYKILTKCSLFQLMATWVCQTSIFLSPFSVNVVHIHSYDVRTTHMFVVPFFKSWGNISCSAFRAATVTICSSCICLSHFLCVSSLSSFTQSAKVNSTTLYMKFSYQLITNDILICFDNLYSLKVFFVPESTWPAYYLTEF